MSLLLDSAPLVVDVGGAEYEIDADFRNCIKFEILMLDEGIPEGARVGLALNLFYPVIPSDIITALEKIIWFYRCGEESTRTGAGSKGSPRKIYSYDHDGAYIYAAFLADYGIDLEAIDFLHWWKFRALFLSLHEDNLACKIMGYRAANIGKMKGEQRKFYQQMKRLYALPVPRGEQEKLDEISAALMSGPILQTYLNEHC